MLDEGRVDITWLITDGNVVLRWKEHGGTRLTASPKVYGFGSELAKNTVVRHFGGRLDYDWQSDGLSVTLILPVARLTDP